MPNRNIKPGFTLIELLVVVLIIGILSAIALPIYLTAVDKSRFTNLMPLAKSVVTAQTEYYLTTGAYTEDFGDLSISLGDGQQISGDTATLQDGQITFKISASGDYLYVSAQDSGLADVYKYYFPKSPQFPGERHCEAPQDNNRANKLCKALNGTEIGTNGEYTVYTLDGEGGGNGTFQCTPVCSGNQICQNGACKCPASLPTWDGSQCQVCTGGQVSSGSGTSNGCICPKANPVWDGQSCQPCPAGTNCSCPASNPVFDGTQCVPCPGGQAATVAGTCVCPASKPVWDGNQCLACPGGQASTPAGTCVCPASNPVWDGTKCSACPGGQVASVAGTCICPISKPIFDGTQCVDCPGGQTADLGGNCSCPKATPIWNGTQCTAA